MVSFVNYTAFYLKQFLNVYTFRSEKLAVYNDQIWFLHFQLSSKKSLSFLFIFRHNLQQYVQFFAKIRLSIEEDNFEEFKGNVLTGHPLW